MISLHLSRVRFFPENTYKQSEADGISVIDLDIKGMLM